MSAPETVQRLIDRFAENQAVYKSASYNETQLRREFLDPFFKSLGWDIDNEQGYAEQWKEVVHEDSLKVGDGTRAPDYSFRLGGRRLFFLEAKKPAVNLKDDPSPAYQLRRYAWTAKMPLSILSDFEEFIVYDTRTKPVAGDPASKARTFYLNYTDYLDKWGEIAGIFSPEAIKRGAFDKYVESATKKRGTAEVDDAFLADIEEWRDLLARNIALRNPGLSQRDLNFAVQRTIDRIIFLRISEDRGIEEYGRLRKISGGKDLYRELCVLFQRADEKYNSGLFHFTRERGRPEEPDTLTPRLAIDDKILKAIFKRLYYPDSPYEFSVFPPEILGHVYERFLGSVIRLTPGGQAKVEQKPEVRKAGGVYYTPTYIVDYIVKHTVGRLLEGKSPQDAAGRTDTWQVSKTRRPLAVLDPACGSGSFLLGAYQFLLDWYLEQYSQKPTTHTKGKEPRLYQDHRGAWRLTTTERKRILIDHIHGVDIDPQAVEVTKLSLLLKVLENENAETLQKQLDLFHDRALPDLANNIKCGNSLIGPDFYQNRQADLFDEEEMYRVNAFDWKAEFPGIMGDGGFDAVIGNPPYIRIQTMREWNPETVDYYGEKYKSAAAGNYDIYVVFVEKGLSLLNEQGRLGFILPHKFFNAQYGEGLRKLVSSRRHLEHVVHFGDEQVFAGAITYTCLLFLSNRAQEDCEFHRVSHLGDWRLNNAFERFRVDNASVTFSEWNFQDKTQSDIALKITSAGSPLHEVSLIFQGLVTGSDKVFVLDSSVDIEDAITRPFLETGQLSAYTTPHPTKRILFPYAIANGKALLIPADDMKKQYPKAWNYLCHHRDSLMNRERGKWHHEKWYAFGRSQNLTQMDSPKLIVQVTAKKPTVLMDRDGLYMTGGGSGPFYGIRPTTDAVSLLWLLGILNSRLFGWTIEKQSTNLRGGYIKFSKQYIASMPVRMPDGTAQEGSMSGLVERMLDLHQRMGSTNTSHEKTLLQRQIAATDREIDQLVYQLYGLTEEEIRIVEGDK